MSRRQLIDRPGLTIPIANPFLPLLHGKQHIKAYYGGRGGAKAIDVAELIPTPAGYTVLGDIQVGDTVFDEAGKPCKVTEIHEQPMPSSAYRLTFSNGATIDCSGDHEWVTWTYVEWKAALSTGFNWQHKVRTTQDIVDTFYDDHHIPLPFTGRPHVRIVATRPIPPKPMRCLTVDGPNHTYLVGAHMIPTHNSWAFARGLIFKAMCEKHFILCTRQFQSSIADSVHRTISQQISNLGLDNHFIVEKKAIYAKLTGTTFIFKGVYHNPGEIKSLEGVSICWVEEGQAMTEESWQILMPTIFRQTNSELWCSFNPENETDATYRRMVLNPQPGSLVVKVSYRDNPWFPKLLEDQRQHMLRTDPDAYDWVWEGNLRSITNAAIFRGNFVVEAFETPNNVDRFYFGADWGFADDPACLIRCYIRDECLFIDYEAYGYHVEIDDLPALFAGGTALKTGTEYPGIPEARDWPIWADSARPETISYIHRRGFNIDAAEKWPGSVEDGIAHLKAFKKIIVHERCKQLAVEMRLYQYKVDDKVDPPVILPKIVDKHNHGIDATRYSLNGFIMGRGGLAIWEKLAS